MLDYQTFLEYAEECRRLARRATPDQKAALLKMADAWMDCAAQFEKSGSKKRGKSSDDGVSSPVE